MNISCFTAEQKATMVDVLAEVIHGNEDYLGNDTYQFGNYAYHSENTDEPIVHNIARQIWNRATGDDLKWE